MENHNMRKMEKSKVLLNVLCLEDELKDTELLNEMLVDAGYLVNMDIAAKEKEYLSFLKGRNYDIILADYTLPGFNVHIALKLALELQPEVPFICASGTISEDKAVELLKLGATDYVFKDRLGRLGFSVRRALELKENQKEWKKAKEEALRESERKFRNYIDFAPHGVFVVDEKGNNAEVNSAASNITGYSKDELLSMKLFELIPEQSLEFSTHDFERIVKGGFVTGESSFIRKDRSRGYWSIETVKLSNQRFLIFVVDVTKRKETEEALLQSEKNFHRSISESPVGIRIVRLDEKTIYANKAFLDIYKINSMEEFTCTHSINRYTPESYAQHQERKEKRKNGHDVFDYEISIICKNAEIRHVKVWRKEVLWNGIKHYQVINIDITELKKLTIDLIVAKEHAEQSDRLKSAFLANMSHEIRTPMNGILGFAELLKEPNLTGEEQQEFIEIIEKSGARMLNIINDIVDISKIESGLMEVNIKESNINEQIEYIYTFFRPEVEGKGMQLSYRNGLVSSESIIKTDREKVFAILTNLVKNAIKYTDKGSIEFGYVSTGSTTDSLGKVSEPVELQFYMKDTGIGIPKDRQKAIFDRFVQADIGDKRAFEGAGLGLSISKAYIEMLGGRIWAESEEGKGSTFYFTLPYNTEHEEKTVVENIVKADVEENQMKKLKILIAEDDKSSDKFISIVVWKFGKEIINVATGTKAVEVCRNNPDIDLVLMDIRMPDMDGHEATRQIRQFNKDVVIIAQTAFALTGDREVALAAGCNDYVSKPIRKDKLMEVMQRYFQ